MTEDAEVERVARAISDSNAPKMGDWERQPEGWQNRCRNQARAAIAALRAWDEKPDFTDEQKRAALSDAEMLLASHAVKARSLVGTIASLILQANHGASSPRGWNDISTAPKDGTPILAYGPETDDGEEFIYVVAWGAPKSWHSPDYKGCWLEAGGERWQKYKPTHWQPLPKHPDQPAQNTGKVKT